MIKFISIFLVILLSFQEMKAQLAKSNKYEFANEATVKYTPVKNQGNTGTCWSFSGISFIESELLRKQGKSFDLSEMFIVRNIYRKKAYNYILKQGKTQFSEGGLIQDVVDAIAENGVVPQAAFPNSKNEETLPNHSGLVEDLQKYLDESSKTLQSGKFIDWKLGVDSILDLRLGKIPKEIIQENKKVTPLELANELGINENEFVLLTSFTHHPFYHSFELEVPDNFSGGRYFNLPMEELKKVMDHALKKGYSIAWDADVSNPGFLAQHGYAFAPGPNSIELEKIKSGIFPSENVVTPQQKQKLFESLNIQDDHLMHIVGSATDKEGRLFYKVKNSWGSVSPYEGLFYASEKYVALNTIGIMVHKKGIPKNIRSKFKK
jgi:bleomycin hydrolase